jgi:hypothetical protein
MPHVVDHGAVVVLQLHTADTCCARREESADALCGQLVVANWCILAGTSTSSLHVDYLTCVCVACPVVGAALEEGGTGGCSGKHQRCRPVRSSGPAQVRLDAGLALHMLLAIGLLQQCHLMTGA